MQKTSSEGHTTQMDVETKTAAARPAQKHMHKEPASPHSAEIQSRAGDPTSFRDTRTNSQELRKTTSLASNAKTRSDAKTTTSVTQNVPVKQTATRTPARSYLSVAKSEERETHHSNIGSSQKASKAQHESPKSVGNTTTGNVAEKRTGAPSFRLRNTENKTSDVHNTTGWTAMPSKRAAKPNSTGCNKQAKNNLIVNFIPRGFTEAQLKELFEPHGNLASVKLVMDHATNSHLGYGFVKYVDEADAARAIEALNGHRIGQKSLKVSVARPRSETGSRSNLYVSGLPVTFTTEDLKAAFGPHGRLIECRVLYDREGISKRVAFVRFHNNEEAESAIRAINGRFVPEGADTPIFVKHASPQRAGWFFKPISVPQEPEFEGVTPAPYQAPYPYGGAYDPQFWTPFNTYNGIAAVPQPPAMTPAPQPDYAMGPSPYSQFHSAGSPLFGSVQDYYGQQVFYDHWMSSPFPRAYRAEPQLTTGVIDPPCVAECADSHSCVFVFHLPPEATESEVRELFSPYGKVTSVKIVKHVLTQEPKGYGFVNYTRPEDAHRAIHALNGHKMGNKFLKVAFKR